MAYGQNGRGTTKGEVTEAYHYEQRADEIHHDEEGRQPRLTRQRTKTTSVAKSCCQPRALLAEWNLYDFSTGTSLLVGGAELRLANPLNDWSDLSPNGKKVTFRSSMRSSAVGTTSDIVALKFCRTGPFRPY
jgi:hypothetical protein